MKYDDITVGSIFDRFRRAYNKRGMAYILCLGAEKLFDQLSCYVAYYYFKIFKSSKTFTFQGERYKYFYHRYNNTWNNERAVEIPIIWAIVKDYREKKKRILESGNVLSHYFHCNHDIIDKYEKDKGIVNEDVVTFQPKGKYDLIVSISTFEHIGWDERPRTPMKIFYAIENLSKCLSYGGKIVATMPIGYNKKMDKFFKSGTIAFTTQYYLKRTSKNNKWVETMRDDVFKLKYGKPFPKANGLIIGIIEKRA